MTFALETAAFLVCIAFMWWAARMMLQSALLAAVAVSALALAPLYTQFQVVPHTAWSEDVYMAAAMAAAFAVWLALHLSGRGTSPLAILVVGFLCALAAAFQQKGLLEAAAFMAYLAWHSPRRNRVINPLIVAGIIAVTYFAMYPLALMDLNAGPWDVGAATIVRRFGSLRHHFAVGGPLSIRESINNTFFWWPLFPAICLAAWASRREKWFPVAGLFWLFLTLGTLDALAQMRVADERYSDPLNLGFFFFASICIIAASKRHAGAQLATPAGAGDAGAVKGGRATREPLARAVVEPAEAEPVASGWTRLRSLAGPVAVVLLLGGVLTEVAIRAARSRALGLDECLWFMRCQTLPTDLSTEEHRLWAVDVPAANRWIYWVLLHATGLNKVPPGEPCHWSMRDGKIYWYDEDVGIHIKRFYADKHSLAKWVAYAGKYSPRKAILAMRAVNVAVFGLYLALVWLSAFAILRSYFLSTTVVVPIVVSPAATVPYGVAFYVWSGDVFMMAAMAGALLVWLRGHMRGAGTSARYVVAVGFLLGVAVASKQHAVFALLAFLVYLVWYSRGWRRVTNALLGAAVASGVYAVINPATILYPGAWPWDVQFMMAERRMEIVTRFIFGFGPATLMEIFTHDFYWWPILPTAAIAAWGCRRERWFAPVFLFGSFMTVLTMVGLIQTRMRQPRYMAPLEFGLYLMVAVCALSVTRRAGPILRVHAPGGAVR